MSDTPEVIELLNDAMGSFIHSEALSAAGSAIIPGMLIEEIAAGTVQEHSGAGLNAQRLFALTNLPVGGDIDDAYGAGVTVRYGAAHSGQEVFGLLAAGATAVIIGTVLESAGDGTVRIVTADAATDTAQRDAIAGYAIEAVDNSGGGTVARLKFRVA